MTTIADSAESRAAAERGAGKSGLFLLKTVATKLTRAVINFVDQRRTMRLLDLDDHMLRDIGLTRSDVTSAIYAGDGPASQHLARRAEERRSAKRLTQAAMASEALSEG